MLETLVHDAMQHEAHSPEASIEVHDCPKDHKVIFVETGYSLGAQKILEILNHGGIETFPIDSPAYSGAVTACYPGFIYRKLKLTELVLQAKVGYDMRHAAKRAGFSWNSWHRRWERKVSPEKLAELNADTTIMFPIVVIDTIERLSDCAIPDDDEERNRERTAKFRMQLTQRTRPGAQLARMRKTFGGPAKVMHICRYCGQHFSARELRMHQGPCGRK